MEERGFASRHNCLLSHSSVCIQNDDGATSHAAMEEGAVEPDHVQLANMTTLWSRSYSKHIILMD